MPRLSAPSRHLLPTALSLVALGASVAGAQHLPQTREALRQLPPADTTVSAAPRRGHSPVEAPTASAGGTTSAPRTVMPMRASGRPADAYDDRDRRPQEHGSSLCKIDAASASGALDLKGWSDGELRSYTIQGCGGHGERYTGTGTIRKIGGSMFSAVAHIGANDFQGVAFGDGDVLSAAWGSSNHQPTVLAYVVRPDGLDGVFFGPGDTRLGSEFLKPLGRMTRLLEGSYRITGGRNPDGSAYTGTARVSLAQGVPPEEGGSTAYTTRWNIGGVAGEGVALRNTGLGTDDVIAAALVPRTGNPVTIEMLTSGRNHGLVGRWLESFGGTLGRGVEIWTRSP